MSGTVSALFCSLRSISFVLFHCRPSAHTAVPCLCWCVLLTPAAWWEEVIYFGGDRTKVIVCFAPSLPSFHHVVAAAGLLFTCIHLIDVFFFQRLHPPPWLLREHQLRVEYIACVTRATQLEERREVEQRNVEKRWLGHMKQWERCRCAEWRGVQVCWWWWGAGGSVGCFFRWIQAIVYSVRVGLRCIVCAVAFQ